MVLNEVAQCAVLLLGGNGLTRSGQGEVVEAIYREVNLARVPGGSEDVMLDLCMRFVASSIYPLFVCLLSSCMWGRMGGQFNVRSVG